MSRVRRVVIPLALSYVVTVTHFLGINTSFDSVWSIPVARSLLSRGTTNLDSYQELLVKNRFFAIESIDGHYYSICPIGASLLAVPVIGVLDVVGITPHATKIEKFVASLVISLTAVLLYGLARQSLDIFRALLWGGHSYGNRMMADVLPYFMYFLIPVVAALPGPARPGRVAPFASPLPPP